jgi:hypothetical protein
MLFPVDPFPVIETDAMVNTGEGYTGNYRGQPGTWLRFEYLGYPSSVQSLYFESSWGSGSTWAYDLTPTAHAWTPVTVSFATSHGWDRVSGTDSFFQALWQVDLIGVTVQHLNLDTPFDYGLDNWQFQYGLAIPEPGVVAVVLTFLFGMLCMYRRSLVTALRSRFRRS